MKIKNFTIIDNQGTELAKYSEIEECIANWKYDLFSFVGYENETCFIFLASDYTNID